ncbi:MAG: A/G-specific adenine glycosylase [Bacteroidota bacterium]|nr:A/G-specific adenine glycosylase [Bacteroidota bacterium]
MSISSTLINWYLQKKRNLPWRNSQNPYHIWLSEVILQQTRVAQGLAYYERFVARFPDIETLANANTDEILKTWQGLGYYSRARNLQTGAQMVMDKFNGQLPGDYNQLLSIKGIGSYTAAAIGSIAFNLPVAVVDGNVNRVISRLFGVHSPVNSTAGMKEIAVIAQNLINPKLPGIHNQAMMEFGALQCTIRNPDCCLCPLQSECYAFKNNEITLLPIKIKQAAVKKRYFTYLVILYHINTYLQKRTEKDIWQGLYEFPLIETEKVVSLQKLKCSPQWNQIFQNVPHEIIETSGLFKHQLSHQQINARFILIKTNDDGINFRKESIAVRTDKIHDFPVSKLIDNYLSAINLSNY